ncbi:MAG: hypothetical protein EWV67_17590 [Microcystis sp. M_QC_C_20170808_M2Col]|nr:MAG: hypothetical protein EWV67_17590 [Microcystis sp. M_QC_C_20170808_M2Col]TRT69915.1 MAG: hypothetical protein EWV68_07730 [Microcystis sp. M_QC_C_20170808_M9Col]
MRNVNLNILKFLQSINNFGLYLSENRTPAKIPHLLLDSGDRIQETPRLFLFILPSSHTPHPTPHTPHPTPHTPHPTPYTLLPSPINGKNPA